MIWKRLCLCMDGGGSAHGVEAVDRGVGVGAGRDGGEGQSAKQEATGQEMV